ncbi:MAG: RlpA-like double-psi beta-barrel domain-containing protein [Solirubrobacterales bacterium]|nr:RlpA-like double-psi beta-barrel domain-containing protein [Solirubrobacterales bacterium]
MRTKIKLRPVAVAAGATMLLIGGSAVALAASQANAQSATQVHLDSRRLSYGHQLKLSGRAASTDAGQTVQLQFAPADGGGWRAVGTSRVRQDGSFVLVTTLRRSGLIRVAGGSASASRGGSTSTSTTALDPSQPQAVSVAARVEVGRGSRNILGNGPAHVRGKLLPLLSARKVTLLGYEHGRWHQLASTRTGRHGGFDFKVAAGGPPRERLLVRFAGDKTNTAAWSYAGRVTTFSPSVASQYDDGGSTACGFHAQFGVANRDLPCGTKVMIAYGGRSVTAVVDDRGPFVGGRDWDLNQNTAGALGFSGVDTVWTAF